MTVGLPFSLSLSFVTDVLDTSAAYKIIEQMKKNVFI